MNKLTGLQAFLHKLNQYRLENKKARSTGGPFCWTYLVPQIGIEPTTY